MRKTVLLYLRWLRNNYWRNSSPNSRNISKLTRWIHYHTLQKLTNCTGKAKYTAIGGLVACYIANEQENGLQHRQLRTPVHKSNQDHTCFIRTWDKLGAKANPHPSRGEGQQARALYKSSLIHILPWHLKRKLVGNNHKEHEQAKRLVGTEANLVLAL